MMIIGIDMLAWEKDHSINVFIREVKGWGLVGGAKMERMYFSVPPKIKMAEQRMKSKRKLYTIKSINKRKPAAKIVFIFSISFIMFPFFYNSSKKS